MYILYRKDYYKRTIYSGIVLCIMCGVLSYHSIARRDEFPAFLMIMLTIWIITVTLYYLIKYLRKDKDFVVLRIDDNGILLCQKKNEEVFIEWEKIKHVIFLRYIRGSKVIVRQHNKETHELFLQSVINLKVSCPEERLKRRINKLMIEIKYYLNLLFVLLLFALLDFSQGRD